MQVVKRTSSVVYERRQNKATFNALRSLSGDGSRIKNTSYIYSVVANHLTIVRREKLTGLSFVVLHTHELQTGEKEITLTQQTHLLVTRRW